MSRWPKDDVVKCHTAIEWCLTTWNQTNNKKKLFAVETRAVRERLEINGKKGLSGWLSTRVSTWSKVPGTINPPSARGRNKKMENQKPIRQKKKVIGAAHQSVSRRSPGTRDQLIDPTHQPPPTRRHRQGFDHVTNYKDCNISAARVAVRRGKSRDQVGSETTNHVTGLQTIIFFWWKLICFSDWIETKPSGSPVMTSSTIGQDLGHVFRETWRDASCCNT